MRDLESGGEHSVAFEEEAYSLGLRGGLAFDTATIRFVYSSMTTPSETWDYDCASRARSLRKGRRCRAGTTRPPT